MLVYSVLFIFILLLSLFMPKDTNKQKKIYLFLCFGSMVLVAGLRKYTIGIDLVELYAPKYIQICHTSFANLQFVHMEYGYVLFNKLLSLISTDVQLLIFTTSLIIYGSYGYFIYKNSKNVAFSTILFIIISLFFMSMNIIRQELSVAFLLIGYEFLKKKKYLAFYIIAFVATLFHQSSIIAFLFPLFYKTKFKKSYFFIGLVAAAVGFVFSTPLINGFTNLISLLGLNNNKDYTMYLSSKAFGVPIINLNSLSGLLLSIAYFVLCYYYFCILKDEKNFDETDNYSLFMIFFYSLFSILSFKMVIIARFQYYFSPFILCAIPNAIKSSKFKSNIAFITSFIIVFVGAKFLYIFLYLADDLYGVMPFTFSGNNSLGGGSMSRTKSAIKNLSFALVGQVVGLIISFIARIIFIKFLNSEYLGLNGLFSNILSMLSLAELGVGTAITYSLYKPLAEKNNDKCTMLMQLYKKIYTFIGVLIFILGVAITPLLPHLISDMPDIKEIYLVYVLFVVNTSISYFFSYKRNLIIADQHRYIATLYRYSFYCLYNLCQIIYLVIFRDYIGFLVIQILSTLLENIFISIKADKMYPFLKSKKKVKLDKKTKKEIIKNTKAMMMHKIGGVVVNSTDNILISKMIGLVTVGIYSNYLLITTALNTVLGQVYNSLTASVGNMVVTNSKEKHYSIYKKIELLTYWIYSFASVCLLCLFNPFITIWIGKEFLFSFEIVLVLTLNFYITGMRKTNLTFREASGLFEKDKWKPIAESTINLAFSILLALKFGVIGVFLGTLISSVTTCLWVEPYVIYKYDFEQPFKEYLFTYLKRFILFVIMASLTYGLCFIIPLTGFLKVVVNLIIALIIPNIVLFVVYRNSDEFCYFKDLISKMLNKIFGLFKRKRN